MTVAEGLQVRIIERSTAIADRYDMVNHLTQLIDAHLSTLSTTRLLGAMGGAKTFPRGGAIEPAFVLCLRVAILCAVRGVRTGLEFRTTEVVAWL